MKNRTLALIGAGLLAGALALGGLSIVLAQGSGWGYWPAGMMDGYGRPGAGPGYGYGRGMMAGGYGRGPGQSGYGYGPGMMEGGYGYGPGMMEGGYGYGPGGMMGGYGGRGYAPGPPTPLAGIADAQKAFQSYIDRTGNADLALDEVMEFQQNFYAIVKEKSTGNGAFELLANKQTGAVFPEYGPNMMWNTKYSPMAGLRGGMMGGRWNPQGGGTMSVTADRAKEIAQQWLNANQPGSTVEAPDAFPGYYTLHILKDGKITGMLSVNGTSGQVWYHSWHGAFIASSEASS